MKPLEAKKSKRKNRVDPRHQLIDEARLRQKPRIRALWIMGSRFRRLSEEFAVTHMLRIISCFETHCVPFEILRQTQDRLSAVSW